MRLLSITVHGSGKTWDFLFYGDPAHIPDWHADGLYVSEVVNTVPYWAAPIARVWCFVQDILQLKNPWR